MGITTCNVVNSRCFVHNRIVRGVLRWGGCAISVESLLNSLDNPEYTGWIFACADKTVVWRREQLIYLLETRDWYKGKGVRDDFCVIEREEFHGHLEVVPNRSVV